MHKDERSKGKRPEASAAGNNRGNKTGYKAGFAPSGAGKAAAGGEKRLDRQTPGKPAERSGAHPGNIGRKVATRNGPRPMAGPNARRGGFAKPAQQNVPGSLSRKVALEIFQDVIHKDAFAALSLDERMQNINMTQLDKRFCASIVYTTLENLIRIDYALSFFLKDVESLEPTVRDILRISVCQLLFHDRVPENAVVDEAVKLTRGAGLEGLTGLTNAVLRSMIRGRNDIKWPSPEEGARYLSIMHSVPLWLAERLLSAYGPETAEKICAYRSQAHYTVIRPNLTRFSDAEFEALLQKKVWEVEKGAVTHAYRVRMASEIARDADYFAGNFSIQGESSMLAAQALQVKRGMQVLDCCAAPGGKTAYLAEEMAGTGRVYAWDVYEHRVTLIKAMMKRLKLENIRPAVRDASIFKEDLEGTMDAVLLDAPCSGLGVMDDKPDIKYRATPESVRELTEIQEKLLDTCCRYVKKGGVMVYSTCSVLPEENSEQIRRFLSSHEEFALSPLPDTIDHRFRAQATDAGLQLLPHRDGVEGFFIARMRRVK